MRWHCIFPECRDSAKKSPFEKCEGQDTNDTSTQLTRLFITPPSLTAYLVFQKKEKSSLKIQKKFSSQD